MQQSIQADNAVVPGPALAPRKRTLMAVYGAVLIGASILALFWPVVTSFAAGFLVAALLLVYAVAAIAAAITGISARSRWIEVALGLLALLAGAVILVDPFLGSASFVWVVGAWLLVSGITSLGYAAKVRENRGWTIALGLVDLVLGLYLLFAPVLAAALIAALFVAVSFFMRGLLLIASALAGRALAD